MRIDRRGFVTAGVGVVGVAAAGSLGCGRAFEAMFPAFVGNREDDAAWTAPDGAELDLIRHLLNRLSSGPTPPEYGRVKMMGDTEEEQAEAYIEEQLHPEEIQDSDAQRMLRRFESLDEPIGELFEYKAAFLREELTRKTLLGAIYSKRQLFELMVGFWSDHFNVDPSKGDSKWLKAADDREVARAHALGKFPALVRASALSPAMLWYLDGRANESRSEGERVNENYARELLELHTLGVHGGYTQTDVMEAARCLSGWTVRSGERRRNGAVEFVAERHDDGEKHVLGTLVPAGGGPRDIDRLVDIVTSHPSTAKYIAEKLCRKFIGGAPGDSTVETVATTFTASGGDIRDCLRSLFHTEEFRSRRGSILKRPFRYLVSALRATHAETDAGRPILRYLERMGHTPFDYPTPDGYPLEPDPWLGTLMWRWGFARELASNGLKGTRIDAKKLADGFSEPQQLVAHLTGTRPDVELQSAISPEGDPIAICLASPGFQYC